MARTFFCPNGGASKSCRRFAAKTLIASSSALFFGSGDAVWTIGWDHRSLLLMVLDGGRWHVFRLPKSSHSYDGAHGWNTEWPRIRDIGEQELLMIMHGSFWRFPRTFSAAYSAGIAPHSTYLKVIGDFCRWNDRVVFGCDDTARSEFLNKRKAKGNIAGPGRSQSNLWFVEPGRIDTLGPVLGRGAVWLADPVKAGAASDPFLAAPARDAGADAAVLAGRPFAVMIASAGAAHGVDVRLVHAVIEAESNYQPRARSRKGAKGLMQLMPATARQYAVRDPYDPQANIEAGVRHLKDLLSRFDVGLALAAYNAGEQAVVRFGGIPPYPETRAYVARILRLVSPRGAGASQPATPGRSVPTRTRPSRS